MDSPCGVYKYWSGICTQIANIGGVMRVSPTALLLILGAVSATSGTIASVAVVRERVCQISPEASQDDDSDISATTTVHAAMVSVPFKNMAFFLLRAKDGCPRSREIISRIIL